MARFTSEQFPSENGVSTEERGTSSNPFLLAQQEPAGPAAIPWSKYVPFAAGTELQVTGSVLGIVQLSGTGKVEERTDAQLNFSASVTGSLFSLELGEAFLAVQITYRGEGGTNLAKFKISGRRAEKNVSIQSTPTQRILTAPGGLRIPTNVDQAPIPKEVLLKEVRFRPLGEHVEIRAKVEGFPEATILIAKKPA